MVKVTSIFVHTWLRALNTDFALNDCLFRAVIFTKNSNADENRYSSYGIGFRPRSEFSSSSGRGRNVVTFAVDNNLSSHTGNRRNISESLVKV